MKFQLTLLLVFNVIIAVAQNAVSVIDNPSIVSGKCVARTVENFILLKLMSNESFEGTMKNVGCSIGFSQDFGLRASEQLDLTSQTCWDGLIFTKFNDRLSVLWHSWEKLNDCETVFGSMTQQLSGSYLGKQGQYIYYEVVYNSQLYNFAFLREVDSSTGKTIWTEQVIVYGPLEKN